MSEENLEEVPPAGEEQQEEAQDEGVEESPKLIVICGATGRLGGSVARKLVEEGWSVRAMTRALDSDAATALVDIGVEIVTGDYDDESSLITAFEGAKAIFAATDYWEHYFVAPEDPAAAGEKEQAQMYTIASAANQIETLEHFIMLSMPSAEKMAPDAGLAVPQFDYKDRAADAIIADFPDLLPRANFLWTGVFTSNWYEEKMVGMERPFEIPNGSSIFTLIHPASGLAAPIPFTDVQANIGVFVSHLLAKPEISLPATYINCASEYLTYPEALQIWSEVSGRQTVYATVSDDDFVALYGPGSLEFIQQLGAFAEANGDIGAGYEDGSVIGAAELGIPAEELVDFRASLQANVDAL